MNSAAALVLVLLLTASGGPAGAQAPPVEHIDASRIIQQLADALTDGRREATLSLSRLFKDELTAMQSMEKNVLYAFSAETMVETLYRRAAATSPSEGDRFLAVLYNDASRTSAAVAVHPAFEHLRAFSPGQLVDPIRFAPIAPALDLELRVPLPAAAEEAIGLLAEVYSGRGLARARAAMLRHLHKPGFDSREFDRALAESGNTRDALRRVIQRGTPPPPATEAVREVLRATVEKSAAFGIDPRTLEVIEALSGTLPAHLDRYRRVEQTLESRKKQADEASKLGEPGTERAARSRDVVDNISRQGRAAPRDATPAATPGLPSLPPTAGSPAPRTRGNADRFSRAYTDYTSRTFAPRRAGPSQSGTALATPRTYRVAIRSVRAARGIALGGRVEGAVSETPLRAIWAANRTDDRFGRLFFEFQGVDGLPPIIAASRVLFADSFYAAKSILWDAHEEEASFRDGEILVLMSMDPEAPFARQALGFLAEKELGLKLSAALASTPDERERLSIEANLLDRQRALVPRGIVLHPAIVGTELGWAAARVDFWFNQIDVLSQESAAVNGGKPMPDELRLLPIDLAHTWQFYERDAKIRLGAADGMARRLVVESGLGKANRARPGSRFAISMFSMSGGRSQFTGPVQEPTAKPLPDLERRVQPLLDWLATNHHDFMRVNDASESFALLRWLRSRALPLTIIDLDGGGQHIATPDRVFIGVGPAVAPR